MSPRLGDPFAEITDPIARAFTGLTDPLYVITLPGEPRPKVRPRFGRRRTYTDPADAAAEAVTGAALSEVFSTPLVGNLAMGCVFFRSTRRRVDADNLLKHVADSGNGIAWLDDSQLTTQLGIVELDRVNPRTVIWVGAHHSTLARTT